MYRFFGISIVIFVLLFSTTARAETTSVVNNVSASVSSSPNGEASAKARVTTVVDGVEVVDEYEFDEGTAVSVSIEAEANTEQAANEEIGGVVGTDTVSISPQPVPIMQKDTLLTEEESTPLMIETQTVSPNEIEKSQEQSSIDQEEPGALQQVIGLVRESVQAISQTIFHALDRIFT